MCFCSTKTLVPIRQGLFTVPAKSLIFPLEKDLKAMRPKTVSDEILGEGIRIRLTTLEKQLLIKRSKQEGYMTLSNFCRSKLVRTREIKKIEASDEFIQTTKKLDYELNKIGVNLNQVSKRLNTHSVYQFTTADREVFRQVLQELKACFSVLQQYLDKIEPR
jgi:hypothetical protein